MKTQKDHFAIIPAHILSSGVSARAKELWAQCALVADKNKNQVWIRQATMAEKLSCSVRTIQRLLKELTNAGLLAATRFWHQGRHKIYALAQRVFKKMDPRLRGEERSDITPAATHVVPRTTSMTPHLRHPRRNLNRVNLTEKEQRAKGHKKTQQERLDAINPFEAQRKKACDAYCAQWHAKQVSF